MRRTAGLLSGRSLLLRVLLVVAIGMGLSAMHVVAGVTGRQHAQVHVSAAPSGAMVGAAPSGHGYLSSTAPRAEHVSDHQHHPVVDCVLFLSAGIALLVVLVAEAAVRALRATYWLVEPWLTAAVAITPWRGPPRWHWPRIALCVIRV